MIENDTLITFLMPDVIFTSVFYFPLLNSSLPVIFQFRLSGSEKVNCPFKKTIILEAAAQNMNPDLRNSVSCVLTIYCWITLKED